MKLILLLSAVVWASPYCVQSDSLNIRRCWYYNIEECRDEADKIAGECRYNLDHKNDAISIFLDQKRIEIEKEKLKNRQRVNDLITNRQP